MDERIPPTNLDAERSVLGSVFVKPLVFATVASELATDDFSLPAHREIFDAMVAVDKRRSPLDVISVGDELKTRGMLPRLDGGEAYLLAMANVTPTAENAVHYIRIVREKAMLRRLIQACAEVQSQAYGDFGEFEEFMSEAVGKVSKVASGARAGISETLVQTYDRIQVELGRAERGESVSRIPTGITRLDRILNGGLAVEHLIIPCALTSMGKSSWAFQVAFRGAAERKIPALLFSLEMSRREAFVKGAATISRVNTNVFNDPVPPNKADWDVIVAAGDKAARLSDLIRIEEHRSIGQIVAVATAWRARTPGPALIVVDHLQKIVGVRAKNANRQEEVWGVARTLKDLAKDLSLPIISPAQLDNDAAKENRAPRIGDIRDSKGIEHEADVVIGIHRDRIEEAGEAELIVLKHRGGRVGKVNVAWVGAYQAFENLDGQERDYHDAS